MDRTELLRRVHQGRTELESALASFDKRDLTEPLLAGGWSIKDIIAHIGFWERRMVNLYGILSAGDVPEDTIDGETLDELNARVFNENRLLPLGIVQVNELTAYQALVTIAETAPDADLFDPRRFAWCEGEPFANWIATNTWEHYADHVPDLRAAASSQT